MIESKTTSILGMPSFAYRYALNGYNVLVTAAGSPLNQILVWRHRNALHLDKWRSVYFAQVPRLVLLKREIDILRTVDHPTLIRLEDVYEDDVHLHLVSNAPGL